MGGVQSGPHSLEEVNNVGRDALWVQERLRQKNSRVSKEGSASRHEHPRGSGPSSVREHKKLLKRTKSLAVISEENRAANNRETNRYRLGQPVLSDAFRRQQLIPRAKLINRHSLKDRLSKSQQHLNGVSFEISNPRVFRSRLTSDTYSVSDPHVSLPNFTAQNLRQNQNPDRLNILDWPESPIPRYQSVQNLDNVSGIVDIVDDNWSSEGNKSIDCIYTQVKRKRKEHRSLDSVLFEEDKELEYFNVLDLLPLSNVRLQFEDRNENRNFELIERKFENRGSPSSINDENEVEDLDEKRRENFYAKKEIAEAVNDSKIKEINDTTKKELNKEKADKSSGEKDAGEEFADELLNKKLKKKVLILDSEEDKYRADVAVIRETEELQRIEEAEDYKSIWISDSEETEEMSRRPQVLKVIDNEVTKRNRNSVIEIGDVVEAVNSSKAMDKRATKSDEVKDDSKVALDDHEVIESPGKLKDEVRVEEVANFFETKCKENGETKVDNAGGKLERIIKETTSIFGKACSVVKGSLGFEARSESSDLGLGSESGSDTRRQSMDEVDETEESSSSLRNRSELSTSNDTENNRSNLSRSFSCMDSVKNENASPEFDHIRYKIMKSDLFSKNIFGSMKKDEAFDGLMQYLQEYSFHDLLVDNNVVIIEPVRAETIERKSSTRCDEKLKNPSSCRIAGAIEKKCQRKTEGENNLENQSKSGKQSSLRKHFFYHPIRVNRELIDDELPDPDTVRNVRKMFEGTLKLKTPDCSFSRNSPTRKTVSMKDLRRIDESFESSDKIEESRSSSGARNLTRLFEKQGDKHSEVNKDGMESPRSDSKTRIIAQVFEARSGQTSPSDGGLSKLQKGIKYLNNWDAGSVSSGVSSDYPDTDQGSGVQCTSSEEEEDEGRDEDEIDNGPGHSVSQDILKKIRECGTSVTYYGGRVVDTYNSPLISPPIRGKMMRKIMRNEPRSKNHDRTSKDYVKFRLVKSNSCDSRLELTGRVVNESKSDKLGRKSNDSEDKESASKSDLRKCPIMESSNVETASTDTTNDEIVEPEIKKEPPIVIGLEPKKEEIKEPEMFKADFKLGRLEDAKCYANKFSNSAYNQWQINDKIEDKKCNFGEIDFEEFEVLEDSLNSNVKKN